VNGALNAVVTGAARGIGAAIAEELVGAGYRVWCWDIDEPGLQRRVLELGADRAIAVACDIRSRASVDAAADTVRRAGATVQALVNNAFAWKPSGRLADVPDDTFASDLDLLVIGPQRVTAALDDLLGAGSAIVTIASVHGMTASPNWGSYDVAKAGLIQWARVVAAELGQRGITSNVIAPGIIQTADYDDESLRALHASAGLLPRVGVPEDVARAVRFLVDPRNDFITGATLAVDGGITTRLALTAVEQALGIASVANGDRR